jgi:hypothetical protein
MPLANGMPVFFLCHPLAGTDGADRMGSMIELLGNPAGRGPIRRIGSDRLGAVGPVARQRLQQGA